MDQFSNLLVSDPIYMAIAVVLAVIILLGVIKKLIKLVLVVSAILVLWIAQTTWTCGDTSIKTLTDEFQSGVEAVKDKASEVGEKARESAVKKIDEKMKNQIIQTLAFHLYHVVSLKVILLYLP